MTTNISKLQEKANKEYPLDDIRTSVSKTEEYNGNEIQLIKRSAFQNGYEQYQKEYEEKLSWISVEEKLPPLNEYVLFKYSEGEYCVGCLKNYGYYCTTYIPAYNDFSSINLLSEVTHWRRFL